LAQNYLKLQARNIFYGAGLSHLVAIENNILSSFPMNFDQEMLCL